MNIWPAGGWQCFTDHSSAKCCLHHVDPEMLVQRGLSKQHCKRREQSLQLLCLTATSIHSPGHATAAMWHPEFQRHLATYYTVCSFMTIMKTGAKLVYHSLKQLERNKPCECRISSEVLLRHTTVVSHFCVHIVRNQTRQQQM